MKIIIFQLVNQKHRICRLCEKNKICSKQIQLVVIFHHLCTQTLRNFRLTEVTEMDASLLSRPALLLRQHFSFKGPLPLTSQAATPGPLVGSAGQHNTPCFQLQIKIAQWGKTPAHTAAQQVIILATQSRTQPKPCLIFCYYVRNNLKDWSSNSSSSWD